MTSDRISPSHQNRRSSYSSVAVRAPDESHSDLASSDRPTARPRPSRSPRRTSSTWVPSGLSRTILFDHEGIIRTSYHFKPFRIKPSTPQSTRKGVPLLGALGRYLEGSESEDNLELSPPSPPRPTQDTSPSPSPPSSPRSPISPPPSPNSPPRSPTSLPIYPNSPPLSPNSPSPPPSSRRFPPTKSKLSPPSPSPASPPPRFSSSPSPPSSPLGHRSPLESRPRHPVKPVSPAHARCGFESYVSEVERYPSRKELEELNQPITSNLRQRKKGKSRSQFDPTTGPAHHTRPKRKRQNEEQIEEVLQRREAESQPSKKKRRTSRHGEPFPKLPRPPKRPKSPWPTPSKKKKSNPKNFRSI